MKARVRYPFATSGILEIPSLVGGCNNLQDCRHNVGNYALTDKSHPPGYIIDVE